MTIQQMKDARVFEFGMTYEQLADFDAEIETMSAVELEELRVIALKQHNKWAREHLAHPSDTSPWDVRIDRVLERGA